jgi:hypothetical protein
MSEKTRIIFVDCAYADLSSARDHNLDQHRSRHLLAVVNIVRERKGHRDLRGRQ